MQVSMAAQRGECGVWIFAGYLVSTCSILYLATCGLVLRPIAPPPLSPAYLNVCAGTKLKLTSISQNTLHSNWPHSCYTLGLRAGIF